MKEFETDGIGRREAIKRTALMLGLALSSSSLTSALARGESGSGATSGARYMNSKEFAAMDALGEVILPRSDTPGARDVGVAAFADVTFGKYMAEEEARVLRNGFAAFDQASEAATGTSFAKLPLDRQITFFGEYSKTKDGNDRRFLRKVRELTLVGYFTSEEVGKNVLKYDPIPGGYVGCIPWEADTPNWAL